VLGLAPTVNVGSAWQAPSLGREGVAEAGEGSPQGATARGSQALVPAGEGATTCEGRDILWEAKQTADLHHGEVGQCGATWKNAILDGAMPALGPTDR
jgi:hypothetical protein